MFVTLVLVWAELLRFLLTLSNSSPSSLRSLFPFSTQSVKSDKTFSPLFHLFCYCHSLHFLSNGIGPRPYCNSLLSVHRHSLQPVLNTAARLIARLSTLNILILIVQISTDVGYSVTQGVNMTSGSPVPLPCISNWIILMQRSSPTVDFYLYWTDYKTGFGNIKGTDFWLGNEVMHLITNVPGITYRLRVEV